MVFTWNDKFGVFGYYNSAMAVALLKQCGGNLTRGNLQARATHLNNIPVPMMLPGITLNTALDDDSPIKRMQLPRFDAAGWQSIGGIVAG